MPTVKMRVLLRCCFLYAFLILCSAHRPVCNVTQHGGKTTYILSGLPPVSSANVPSCEYSWNCKGHVLANHKDQHNKDVIKNNISTLVTSRCLPVIDFMRSCITEREAYVVNCTAQCHGTLIVENKEISYIWPVAVAAVVVVSLIVLLLVIGVLRHKKKNQQQDNRCSQLSFKYSCMMKTDEEAGAP